MEKVINKLGDKTNKCECCEKEHTSLKYSYWQYGCICENCWEMIVEKTYDK